VTNLAATRTSHDQIDQVPGLVSRRRASTRTEGYKQGEYTSMGSIRGRRRTTGLFIKGVLDRHVVRKVCISSFQLWPCSTRRPAPPSESLSFPLYVPPVSPRHQPYVAHPARFHLERLRPFHSVLRRHGPEPSSWPCSVRFDTCTAECGQSTCDRFPRPAN